MSTIWVFKGGWQLQKSAVNLQSGGVLFDYQEEDEETSAAVIGPLNPRFLLLYLF